MQEISKSGPLIIDRIRGVDGSRQSLIDASGTVLIFFNCSTRETFLFVCFCGISLVTIRSNTSMNVCDLPLHVLSNAAPF